MSSDLVQESCRRFRRIEADATVNSFLCEPAPPNGTVAFAWQHFFQAHFIYSELVQVKTACRNESAPGSVQEDLAWWLHAQARPKNPIGIALATKLPGWQNRERTEVREFLARVLLLCVELFEAVVRAPFCLPAPPEHFIFPCAKRLPDNYLAVALEKTGTQQEWHTESFVAVPIICTATIEHRHPGGAEVRFPHPDGGWIRGIVPLHELPVQAEEGDEIDVEFLEEADGAAQCHVIRESWKPRARTPLSEFEHLLPELPEDGADEATMAAYHQALRHAVGKG